MNLGGRSLKFRFGFNSSTPVGRYVTRQTCRDSVTTSQTYIGDNTSILLLQSIVANSRAANYSD